MKIYPRQLFIPWEIYYRSGYGYTVFTLMSYIGCHKEPFIQGFLTRTTLNIAQCIISYPFCTTLHECNHVSWNRRFRWSLWNPNRWSLCNIKHNATRRQPLNSDLNPDGRKQGPWSPGTNHIHAWIPQVGYTNSEPTNESSRSRKIGTLCERANQISRIPLEEGYPDFVYK